MHARRNRPIGILTWLFVLGFGLTRVAADSASPPIEYQVKTSYLYNFLQFVEWVDDGDLPSHEYVLGVLGAERLGSALDALDGETVRGRRIVVRRLGRTDAIGPCHLLFVSEGAADDESVLLAPLRGRPVLTVGESQRFLDQGGIIRFVIVDNKVRFEINPDAAREAGLRIGSQLLRLGTR